MSKERFAALVSDYCSQVGLDGAAQILQGAPVSVDGVLFALTHDDNVHPNLAYAYGDLGPVPEDQRQEICRTLLALNMILHPATGQAMMISPATGRILLGRHFCLDKLTADELGQALSAMSKAALTWREKPFLKPSDIPAGPLSSEPRSPSDRGRFMRHVAKNTGHEGR
jgi:hypothetical protein